MIIWLSDDPTELGPRLINSQQRLFYIHRADGLAKKPCPVASSIVIPGAEFGLPGMSDARNYSCVNSGAYVKSRPVA